MSVHLPIVYGCFHFIRLELWQRLYGPQSWTHSLSGSLQQSLPTSPLTNENFSLLFLRYLISNAFILDMHLSFILGSKTVGLSSKINLSFVNSSKKYIYDCRRKCSDWPGVPTGFSLTIDIDRHATEQKGPSAIKSTCSKRLPGVRPWLWCWDYTGEKESVSLLVLMEWPVLISGAPEQLEHWPSLFLMSWKVDGLPLCPFIIPTSSPHQSLTWEASKCFWLFCSLTVCLPCSVSAA